MKAIKDASTLKNQDEQRSYLGLPTFYARLLKNLSTVVAPHKLLLIKNTFDLDGDEKEALAMILSIMVNISKVFIRNYEGAKWLQGTVVRLEGDRNAVIDVGYIIWRRSVDQLRPVSDGAWIPAKTSAATSLPPVFSPAHENHRGRSASSDDASPTTSDESSPTLLTRRNPPRLRLSLNVFVLVTIEGQGVVIINF